MNAGLSAPVALVTGATSGIGLSCARQLAAEGYALVLVGRSAEALEAAAAALPTADDGGAGTLILVADLSTDDGIRAVCDHISTRRTDVVVNSAGFGIATGSLDTDPELLARQSHVISRAVQSISTVAAQRMVERGRGGIVNITSLAALSTMGVYAAEKAAATVFTEDLAVSLRGTGVTATAVLPGFVRTEFHERMGVETGAPRWAFMDADEVAAIALRDARRGRVLSIPGRRNAFAYSVSKITPRWLMRMLSGGFRNSRRPVATDVECGRRRDLNSRVSPSESQKSK